MMESLGRDGIAKGKTECQLRDSPEVLFPTMPLKQVENRDTRSTHETWTHATT